MSENTAVKKPHIVFQVLNFIKSKSPLNKQLLPIDRLLLMVLASHFGAKGIYPSTKTLADELQITPTYVKLRIAYLESIKMIKVVRKFGCRSNYFLEFLSTDQSTTVDQSIRVDQSTTVEATGQLQLHNRSTPVDTISINNQFRRNNTERGRKKTRPFPLPENFEPGKAAIATAKECGLSVEEANVSFEMFMNHHMGKGTVAVNWQLMLSNWFIREAKIKEEKRKKFNGAAKAEPRSTVPWRTPDPLAEARIHELGRKGERKTSSN